MLKIRLMENGDKDPVLSLEEKLFSDPWGNSSLESFLSSPFAKGYVAEEDGKILAYLLGNLLLGEGEVLRIGTDPVHQKKGVGKKLLKQFCDDLALGDAQSIFLEVRESNVAARALYEKTGFLVMGKRKNYYINPKEDAVLYQLNLMKE